MFRAASAYHPSARIARTGGFVIAFALLASSSGCSVMQWCGCISPPPPPGVNEVTAIWFDQIQYAQDSANGGRQLPGLVGRVLLRSEEKKAMVEAQGMICADMWDQTPGAEPRKLAEWKFDKESLKLLKRSDIMGMGYTIFLPYDPYTPALKKVLVRVCYIEPGKPPHYADPQTVSLKAAEAGPLVQQINYEDVPALRQGLPKAK